jgi:GcrA cell cycle regulator
MSWDAKGVALLKKLWAVGQSAAQIARRLGCSRNAICGRLTRFGLKRGHKPPTAKPKIRPVPKAGVVGRLCPPGCKEGVAEDGREAA